VAAASKSVFQRQIGERLTESLPFSMMNGKHVLTIFPLNEAIDGGRQMKCRMTHIGTATLLLEIGPIRLLTDPVFDPPGGNYHFGYGTSSKKLTPPAMRPEEIGSVDAVLLSHDQHEDNLDRSGRAFLSNARQVLTTIAAAKRLGQHAIGLTPWQSATVKSDDLEIKVTAVPARHGSLGSHLLVGETTGFVLEWPGQEKGALYISGDSVWFHGIPEIAKHFRIGTAILHIGKAGFLSTGPVWFTFSAKEAVRVVKALNPQTIIPIHYEGWKHFREPRALAEKEFLAAGIQDKVQWLPLGKPMDMEI
jgi:L-ascorbate metabolism protein UlaG (beta-lactamase superfamily)